MKNRIKKIVKTFFQNLGTKHCSFPLRGVTTIKINFHLLFDLVMRTFFYTTVLVLCGCFSALWAKSPVVSPSFDLQDPIENEGPATTIVTIPLGKSVMLQTTEVLSSDRASRGMLVKLRVMMDVSVDGYTVIRTNAIAFGQVVRVENQFSPNPLGGRRAARFANQKD